MTEDLENVLEPTEKEIRDLMTSTNDSYYSARETLRERAYGNKVPYGFQSWGDYWKSY